MKYSATVKYPVTHLPAFVFSFLPCVSSFFLFVYFLFPVTFARNTTGV